MGGVSPPLPREQQGGLLSFCVTDDAVNFYFSESCFVPEVPVILWRLELLQVFEGMKEKGKRCIYLPLELCV